ncbi:hypothetical protein [Candidatus Mycolicibacterium alkanivorans]|uniref:Intersectin-EH binding protein Ibp1 n=1 Tax=Candidatus Mycolicibacterium alkanivorans TaxID=2954114 RepID=A0ABS9YXF1_9MYCO|nr:hypothetical protein [Candidatus Mycolicibacterium alkanivorans]MCI4675592.1 hypothetical protein [Candidatus Mycolicibacterium alkanivorans]
MTTVSIGTRRLAYVLAGAVIAAAPAVAVFAVSHSGPGPRVLACSETETEDNFSMNCAPSVIPDVSDNLTEAEVAQPGFNAVPGGGGEVRVGGGGGGHAGR